MTEARQNIIERLQKDILGWQGFVSPAVGEQKGIGLGPVETAFPNGVFPTGNIHEMLCGQQEQAAATSGLMMGILSVLMKNGGACIWISTGRKFFPASAHQFGVAAHRLVFVDTQRERDTLWAMEEALKCESIAAVVAEVNDLSFAQSRRLQLVVEASKVTGFVMRSNLQKLSTTTCVARWQVTPLPSQTEGDLPGVGFPCWQVQLLRVRNGLPGTWQLSWSDQGFTWGTEQEPQIEYTDVQLQVG
ncbi:Error-prone repair protein ImuA [Mucilaginibacter achroorhodeus]|uniref:Error-prone repair protein ImuA n=1 Tax=Mucilaginibacter achroorhodeus TaxID=2599294 RepID=A0A563U4F5_9SPHI|nr:Error-prone repair protein ImuA [Mucilaginibacter achroorhodeus]TWR26202.1 Error-prone repair protein ImuA [Mucilaginibacter achroorhodeus]